MMDKTYNPDSVVKSSPIPTKSSPIEPQRDRSMTVPRDRAQTEFDRKDGGPLTKTAPPTMDNNVKRK